MTGAEKQTGHLQIIATADGSNTIYNALVGENYHSRNGALQESRHVFLQAGLEYYLGNHPQDHQEINILEVGFGTGLNFLLTAGYCTQKAIQLNYIGIEAYPLSPEMIAGTGYQQYVPDTIWTRFNDVYPQCLLADVALTDHCHLQVAESTLASFETNRRYEVIYYDAFASASQPEMWTDEVINHTLKFLKPGGVFVTYAITGNLKRMIKAAGLTAQKIPGAPGKREMLRAVKTGS